MADLPLINIKALLVEREDMDAGVVQQLRSALAETPQQFMALREATETLEDRLMQGKGDPSKLQLKLGVASFFLGKMERAAENLEPVKGPLARFYLGQVYNDLSRYKDAANALDTAAKAGYAPSEVNLHKAASLRGMGKYDEAITALNSLDKYIHNTAEYRYQYAAVLSAQGKDAEAVQYYEKALEADPRHPGALFHLAYMNDKAGNDDEAISLYERCLQSPPARVGTLINLGILYEDHERYDKASYCFEQVLKFNPQHERARLFLKDASASRSQAVADDIELRGGFSAILDVPVTDFELSVRSRNCLKKMNIRTLGDLTRCSEQQLLASKNFGETSLHEIKEMLSLRNLRLGQALEHPTRRTHGMLNPEEYSPQEQQLFAKPVSELNLSVRARKCMTRLGIGTIGELLTHTGDELLECKNFGVTSLVEVKEKLTLISLKLRGD